MNRRFRPPPLAGFYVAEGDDHNRALAEAREQGYAVGYAQGLLEGHEAGAEEATAATREALRPELDGLRETCAQGEAHGAVADALRRLLAARQSDLASLELGVRQIVAVVIETLFPTLLATAIGTEITALVADALAERGAEVLTLRAHPDTLAATAAETATEVQDGRLVLAPDPTQPFGVAEVAWNGGGISFNPSALLTSVRSVLTGSAIVESFATPQPSKAFP